MSKHIKFKQVIFTWQARVEKMIPSTPIFCFNCLGYTVVMLAFL